jgi:hypothetical protein
MVNWGSVEVLIMKSWALAAILVSIGAFVACSDSGGTGGNGGTGAGDGAGGTGGKTSSSSSTSSTSDTSSSSSGMSICDDTETDCGGDSRSGCWKCATDGPCQSTLADCVAGNDECSALVACLDVCGTAPDPTCISDCRAQHPDGTEGYDAIIRCITCDQCPTACNAEGEPLCQP